MEHDPDQLKIDALTARIGRAEQGAPSAAARRDGRPVTMGRLGFDFVGTILGGTLAGGLIDHFMPQLAPWAMIGMTGAGFVGGIMNVWRGLAAPEDKRKAG